MPKGYKVFPFMKAVRGVRINGKPTYIKIKGKLPKAFRKINGSFNGHSLFQKK